MKHSILVRFTYDATHNWPQAEEIAGKEVAYLKYPHRHLFHFECRKEVTELDREIEIILFRKKILNFIGENYNHDFGHLSCEMIAELILTEFDLNYCEVTEDGENGAVCEK